MFRRVTRAVTSLAARHASTTWYFQNSDWLDEWVTIDDAAQTATIGVTKCALGNIGEIYHIYDFPTVGDVVHADAVVARCETAKLAFHAYSPVTGVVQAVNKDLLQCPGLLNDDPEGGGWIVKIGLSQHAVDSSKLLNREQYDNFCTEHRQR